VEVNDEIGALMNNIAMLMFPPKNTAIEFTIGNIIMSNAETGSPI